VRSRPPAAGALASAAELTASIRSPAVRTPWRDAWRRFKRHRFALASLIFVGALILVAIFAPLIAPYGFQEIGFGRLDGASRSHPMGTDVLGRDLFSRVVYGTRVAIEIGVGSQLIAVALGATVGAVAGLAGGVVDSILMRLTDVMLALPPILIALLFIIYLGSSVWAVMAALGIASWGVIARLARGAVLDIKEREFIEAARSIGCSPLRVLRHHIVPHAFPAIVIQASFGVAQAIYHEAFLSFLGLGVQPPSPTWGRLIVDGFPYIQVTPHVILFPTLVIFLTLIALNALGDGLRDALDPKN
jgi:ABC-type dipeptide/oligopeptide/nickel transport system permease subunit